MKTFTIVFGINGTIGILYRYQAEDPHGSIFVLTGWYDKTLKGAYTKYQRNPQGLWFSMLSGSIPNDGCTGWSDIEQYMIADILMDISEETLLNLIKLEELGGTL